MRALLDLFHGRFPLRTALWRWALLWGTLLNLAGLFAALVLATREAPGWLIAAVFLAPLAYVVLAVIGVWRSAARPEVAPREAATARLVALLWAAAMVVL